MRTNRRDHVSPVLASLHWLPVKFRIEFKILLLTYKALNGQGLSCLKDLIVRYFPNRALRSQTKSRMGGRAFSYQTPLLWNKLPINVREADTLSTFKTLLFDKAYSWLRDGSGDPETSHGYAAIALDCWGASSVTPFLTLFSFSPFYFSNYIMYM